MKVLLDEQLDVRLKVLFSVDGLSTGTKKNALLRLAGVDNVLFL